MSHNERFKGRDKKTHKMTRDGLVERNAATGEESRISQRRQDFKLRDRLTEGADGRGPAPDSERGARSQRRPQAFTQEEAIPRINQTQTADSSQNIRQLDVDFRSENTTHTTSEASHTLDADDKALPSEPAISQRGGEQAHPSRQHGSRYQRQFQSDTQGGVDLPARDADTSPISDVPPFQVTLSVPPAGRKSDGLPLDELLTPAGDGISDTPPAMERPGRLLFDASAPAAPAGTKPNQRGTGYARKFMEKQPAETVGGTDRQGTSAPDSHSDNASDGNPAKPSRLQFGKEELPPPKDAGAGSAGKMDKRLEKSRLKAEHSAKKLAAAKKKLPTRKKLRLEKSFDAEHGEVKRQLRFEQEVKSQRAHLKGPVPTRPVKAGANAAIGYAHTKIHQAEKENVGVEAGHKGELMAEGLARRAYRLHKTAPYRRVAKWERRTQKHAVNHAYRQALHDNPQLQSSTLSRFLQKQRIKRQYAKAAREAKRGAKAAKKAGENAAKLTQAVIGFVRRHPVGVGIALLILMTVLLIMTMFGSCSNMALGVLSSVTTGSYVAEDRDIDDAELYYTEWEADLQIQIDNAERDHPGFDEYRYNVDDISHDPYELMAFLTAKYQDFTFAGIRAELRTIFEEQYTLSFVEETEIRYRTETRTDTWTDAEGNTYTDTYEVEVPYEWHILNVSLTSRSFSDIISARMDREQQEHFGVLMSTKGNRQYALNPFSGNWLPYVTSYYGWRVHPISGEKDYHKGIDIGMPAGTEILAAHDGSVTLAGDSGGYGLVAVLEDGKGLVTKYAHCSQLLVSAGQEIKKGDVIAKVGSTGNSTGPHLHFEVIYKNQYLNPLFFSETGDDGLGRIPPGQAGGVEFPAYPGAPMGSGSYAALMEEAQKHLGKPYVFGAKGPDKFDCSGFVCWSLSKSGVRNIATNAQGLYNASTPVSRENAQPGDLIFFKGTYSTHNTVTHVGIYIGNGQMIHAGKPVQYASIDTRYWTEHFYSFGRIN